MSNIKAINFQHPSSSTVNMVFDSSGNTTHGGTVADSTAIIRPLVSGTSVATTSGTVANIGSIPAWTKRITAILQGITVSAATVTGPYLQVGTSSGIVTSGYTGTTAALASGSTSLSAFTVGFGYSTAMSGPFSGSIVLTNITGNTWVASGMYTYQNGVMYPVGYVTLSAALTQVQFNTNSACTFTAGSFNILYE